MHDDPKIPSVVVEHVVVDAEIEAAAVTDSNGAGLVADEKEVIAAADLPNQCRRRTIRHRPVRVRRRVALATRAVATARSPADGAGGLEIDGLPRPEVDTGVVPGHIGGHDRLPLAHAAGTPAQRGAADAATA